MDLIRVLHAGVCLAFLAAGMLLLGVPSVAETFFSHRWLAPAAMLAAGAVFGVAFLSISSAARELADGIAQLRAVIHDEDDAAVVTARLSLGQLIGTFAGELTQREMSRLDAVASAAALQRERRRLSRLLDSMQDGIVTVDLAQNVIFASRAAAPFLKVPTDEAEGKPVVACFKDQDVLELVAGRNTGRMAHGMRTVELPPEPDSDRDYYAVSLWPAYEDDGAPVGQVLLFRNISRIKSAEELQADFMDSVAHELRTPLTSIRAYVELLIDDEAGDPETKYKFYNVIYEETYRLSQLIDNLLNISMMESAYPKLDVAPVRLKKLVEDCLTVVASQCERKQIVLEAQLGDRLPTFNLDKKLISVAFNNILSNAVKYTGEGGSITIATNRDDTEFRVTCRDTGIGIAEDHLPRIFDKFFRCAPTDGVDVPGSGVGLATALQIMRQHGGDIQVQSQVGEGSVFSLVFPCSLINPAMGE